MPSLNIRFCLDAGEMALIAEWGELVFALLPGRSGFPGLYAFENCSSPSWKPFLIPDWRDGDAEALPWPGRDFDGPRLALLPLLPDLGLLEFLYAYEDV